MHHSISKYIYVSFKFSHSLASSKWELCPLKSIFTETTLSLATSALRQIFRLFGPPPPHLRKHVLWTENKQKLQFSNPPPPTSAYVIYEWSLNSINFSVFFRQQSLILYPSLENSIIDITLVHSVWQQQDLELVFYRIVYFFFALSDKTLLLQEDDEVAIRWGANEDMRWKIRKMRKYEKKIKDEKMMRITNTFKTTLPKQF